MALADTAQKEEQPILSHPIAIIYDSHGLIIALI
jgi:hypothetical protein